MVRFLTFTFSFLCLNSCMRYNEYGTYRVGLSKFTIKPNSDDRAYTIIDTNVIYRLVKNEGTNQPIIGEYYKFYSKGRVGKFNEQNVNLKTEKNLETKKGYMGYYNFDGRNFIVQFYNSNYNASELEKDILTVSKDTIILTKPHFLKKDDSIPYALTKFFLIKESIPKNIKITKPDW